jgi:NAD+ synthase
MSDRLTIALAQLNPVVGDIAGNLEKLRAARAMAHAARADIVVFSELFLSGYPPEDLVVKPAFMEEVMKAAEILARESGYGGPAIIVGLPWRQDCARPFNAAAVFDQGRLQGVRYKTTLPNYGVFDEYRVFEAGPPPMPVEIRGVPIGLPICEDIWVSDVVTCLKETGAQLLVSPNGSPFEANKHSLRLHQAQARVKQSGLPLIYVNQVGGQDELVFDGASFILDGEGALMHQLPDWQEAVTLTKWERRAGGWICEKGNCANLAVGDEAIYRAVMIGLKDYVEKNRFPGIVLGLSGGIDSALTAVLAVDALGASRVWCFMLPSEFTSEESLEDAMACARLLDLRLDTLPIGDIVAEAERSLAHLFSGHMRNITEENIQSRSRALLLMAVSNKFGHMLVTTGNKSEMSVGYATLYGDMCGGFNPLKDIYKTRIFSLARWRNAHKPHDACGPSGQVIPERILSKAPTAELRPNQTDQDSLPPYEVLDDILECLIEHEMRYEEVVARGHAPDIVRQVENQLYTAEYKRRQAPPGVKISLRNFGRDRRYPITNRFRDAPTRWTE